MLLATSRCPFCVGSLPRRSFAKRMFSFAGGKEVCLHCGRTFTRGMGDQVATAYAKTIQEFRDLHRSGEPIIVLDVRTERSYRDDPEIGVGAIRFPPDDAVRLARERRLDQQATLVLYCT